MSKNYRSRQERRKVQESTKRDSQKKLKSGKTPVWKKIAITVIIVAILTIIGGGVTAAAIISKAPPLDPEELVFSQAAEIYDQNNEEVTQLQASENRDLIDIDNLPEHAKAAFIAIEDVRFYDHFGIDIKRLFGAIAANISEGFGAEGASTITQQVVKNAFLSQEKTITRKLQEQYLAIKLEQQYSKDQILEMYLNLIFFNHKAYGVGEAASVYFDKDVSELTIEDAALLAAIPRRPSYYDPINNPEAAMERRNLIIDTMAEHHFISVDDAEEAKSVSIEEQLNFNPNDQTVLYDSFITRVQSELEEVDGITTSDIYSAGLKIYTTLDTNIQKHAEEVIQTNQHIGHYPDSEEFQVGFTLLDTETGAIKAMVGNRQSQDIARGFNYATHSNASPGSTIKPVLDYGPAIEYNQWSTHHQITDEPHEYSGGDEIRNYSGTYAGNVSMREALVRSLNIPAVKTLQEIGLDRAINFGKGVGLPLENQLFESAALGGGIEASSLDMAGAYASFGNGGTYNEPYTVRKIEFPDGRVIDLQTNSQKAMEDYTAYMITDMLKDVVQRGTGQGANIPGLPVAGKTGTTNFTDEEHQRYNIPPGGDPDVWFAGYTTQYTASVWTGFSGNRGDNYLINNQSNIAKEIFQLVMSHASANVDTPDFVKPDSVEEIALERGTGRRASPYTPSSQIIRELFVKGTGPKTVSREYSTPEQITGLNAVYDEEADAIRVSWNYDEGESQGRVFEIEHRVGDGEFQSIQTQNNMQFSFVQPEKGATHFFRVTVINQEGPPDTSDSAEIQVNVPASEEDDDTVENDEEENDNENNEEDMDPSENEPPESNNGNNNGRNNDNQDNNNENNNGNGNNPGNNQGNNNNSNSSNDSQENTDSDESGQADNESSPETSDDESESNENDDD